MAKTRILVVDDARLMRTFVTKAFNGVPDVSIDEAENGLQAQAMLLEDDYDLILCDWDMPQMSGHELLGWIRSQADQRLKTLPFIMVTGSGEKEKVVEAVKTGVNGYVVKPFTANQLLRQVQETLTKAHQAQAGSGDDKAVRRSGTTQVRFKGGAMQLELISVAGNGLIGRLPSNEPLPRVLAPVMADLKRAESHEAVSIPGYVFRIEASEDHPKSQLLNIGIRFVDMDASKKAFLINFIAAFRR